MEIALFPRTFTVQPGMAQTAEGQVSVMRVTVMDIGGTVATFTFGLRDWEGFQRAVADHERFAEEMAAAARSAEARSKLVLAGSPLGPQQGRRTKQ